MTRSFLNEMQEVDAEAVMSRIDGNAPKEELYFVTSEFLEPYLRYIKANKRLFSTVLKRSEQLRLERSYEDMLSLVITPVLDRFKVPETDRGYLMAFFMKGLVAMLEHWISRDCADSVGYVSGMIQSLVLKPGER